MILINETKKMELIEKNLSNKDPFFLYEKDIIYKKLQKLSKIKLGNVLKIKGKILDKTFEIYQNNSINTTTDKNYLAIKTYSGIMYKNIHQLNFKKEDINFIGKKIYILSSMYGLLNGLDGITEYRLDYASKKFMKINLYDYWKEKITAYLLKQLKKNKDNQLLLLISLEYEKSIDLEKLKQENILIFQISSEDKIPSTFLKIIRGNILSYCLKKKINDYNYLQDYQDELCKVIKIKQNNIFIELIK